MTDELANAIRTQSLLKIWYAPGERLVEPHAFGRSSKGDLLLRAFQVSGVSSSGEHENWKLFRVDRLGSVELAPNTFDGPRPGYRKGDTAMKGGIIEEL